MVYLVRLEDEAAEAYPLADRINGLALSDLLGPGIWLPGRENFFDLLGLLEEKDGMSLIPLRCLDDSAARAIDNETETRQRDGYLLGPQTWQDPLEVALCLQSVLACLESQPTFLPYDFTGNVFERTTQLLGDLIAQCLWSAERKSRVRFAVVALPADEN